MSDFLSFSARRLAVRVLARHFGDRGYEVPRHQVQATRFGQLHDADEFDLAREPLEALVHPDHLRRDANAFGDFSARKARAVKACDCLHGAKRNTPSR